MRFVLPSKPRHRHPLARVLSLILGLAVVGVLLVFGLVVAGVLLVGGTAWLALRQWKFAHAQTGATSAATPKSAARGAEVIEGDFTVLDHRRPVVH